MTYIKFDQGDIKRFTLTEINTLNSKIKNNGYTLILRGYIQCEKCLSTYPLDMYIEDNGFKCWDCGYEKKEAETVE